MKNGVAHNCRNVLIVDDAPNDDGSFSGCCILPAFFDTDPEEHKSMGVWTWEDSAEPIGGRWFDSREKAKKYAQREGWYVR